MKRIKFSQAELEALQALISIADAGLADEGDYQGFNYAAMDTAGTKIAALLQRIMKRKGKGMTIDELKKLALTSLDYGVKYIRDKGGFNQMFHLIPREGPAEIMMLDGIISNSAKAKGAIADLIHMRVAAGDIEAVLMISDIFYSTDMSPENYKLRKKMRWNIEESSARGLCTKHEAIAVTLESPIYQMVARQEYRRVGDPERIELVGDVVTIDTTAQGWQVEGRFTNYWPRQKGASQ